jgi:hypothetical protein
LGRTSPFVTSACLLLQSPLTFIGSQGAASMLCSPLAQF